MSLGLTYKDLRLRVAEFLGVADYSSGPAALPTDSHDLDLVGRVVNDGYRRFITEHEWSFLYPLLEIQLQADRSGTGLERATYDMPSDFAGLVNDTMTFQDVDRGVFKLHQVPEEDIRAANAMGTVESTPHKFAFRPKSSVNHDTADDPRWEILFWPIPNLDGVVVGRYQRFPTSLDNDNDRPLGGTQHDQTVLQACLATAELMRDDTQGVHEQRFQDQLGKSITRDRRSKPARILDYGPKPKGAAVGDIFPSSIDVGGTNVFKD